MKTGAYDKQWLIKHCFTVGIIFSAFEFIDLGFYDFSAHSLEIPFCRNLFFIEDFETN